MKFPIATLRDREFQAICFGYNSCDILCLLPHYPACGEKLGMLQMVRSGGGQAATAAACLGKLGVRTKYLGKFGDTSEAAFSRSSLANVGVDIADCYVIPDTQNQVAIVWIDQSSGERTITHLRAPQLRIAPGDFKREQIHSGGLLFLDGHDIPAAIQLASWAREEGMPVLLDIEKVREGISALLDLCDFVLTNRQFPALYTDEKEPEKALLQIQKRHRNLFVAMTSGASGSLALVDGRYLHTPAYEVDAVDTTGAGDVWHGAFAAGLIWGWDVEKILRFAAAAAAVKCCKIGGRDGIGTREEVIEFMKHAKTIEATI